MANTWHIAALYRFADLRYLHRKLAAQLRHAGPRHGIMGTLLLADEGINGTIAAPDKVALAHYISMIRRVRGLQQLELKFATCEKCPFTRFKIKEKAEIVTFRQPNLDPLEDSGTYVEPDQWNALIEDPGVLVIDTRNHYEYKVGRFKGAVDPQTKNFTEFTEYVKQQVDSNKHKKVAMYCTGGIRCEKATALLRRQGVEEVYHLHGGILKYLETVPESRSRWDGECFVFDYRVAVDHKLRPSKQWMIDANTYLPARRGAESP